MLPVGLSTGALMAVLLCVALLIGTEHTPVRSATHLRTHTVKHMISPAVELVRSNTAEAAASSPETQRYRVHRY